jgi:hypothetical protein
MKKSVQKTHSPTPVIAVRVPALLHLRIQTSAAQAGRSMSSEMARLLEGGLKRDQELAERGPILDEARRLLHEASEHARRIPKDALELELRRQNWRRNPKGGWDPPEVHGLPSNEFIPSPPQEQERNAS